MNCFRVQSLLSAYVDQELSTEDRRIMRAHLFKCPECSREMESLILVKNLMGRLSAPEIQIDSLRLVHEEIYGLTNNDSHSFNHSYFDLRHLLMTAACISLFLMTSTVIFPRLQSKPEMDANAKSFKINPGTTQEMASSRPNRVNIQTQPVSTDQQKEKKENTPQMFNRLQISPILSGTPVSR